MTWRHKHRRGAGLLGPPLCVAAALRRL